MSCTKFEAAHRLIATWVEPVIDDPDYALRIPLSAVLTVDHIDAVARLDLYADYDIACRARLLKQTNWDEHRGRELIRQWLQPQKGGVQ
jgi:hypothetical protein